MKYLLLALLTLLAFLSGCKGYISGYDYSKLTGEEVTKVAEFLSVSKERLDAYADGNITVEELGVSVDRVRQAIEYVKGK